MLNDFKAEMLLLYKFMFFEELFKTEQINFARERQAAVQPTINAASKMFAPSQTVHLMNIYLCMHTQLGGIYSPPPTHTHVYTNSIA